MSEKNKPNELYITRIYDAPIDMVWEAWTDPDQVAEWWGPRGFTLTTHQKDLRPGGIWWYTMHGPDGTDYPNKTLYHEVEPCKRLVYDHGGYDDRPPLFRVTVNFQEQGEKTLMDMTMALTTPEAAKEISEFIKKAGGNATWDRLAEYLDKKHSGKETFVIHRVFQASIDTIFQMWTDPVHFAKWLPPTGATMKILKGEIKSGSEIFYQMLFGTDMVMYGKVKYLEIAPPKQLTYLQWFCDKEGYISRHPMAPTWPETMLTNIIFSEENPEQTRVSVVWEPHGKCTAEEMEAFVKERGGMTQGWTGSFDKLDAYLK